jgi:predicted ester cyclase
MVAEGDLVATQVTMTGTHRGPFAGIDATGRAVRRKEMLMHRVVGGKLVEGWSLPDRKGLLDQLQAP